MLRRTPGSSILAVLCLTLGIGSNAVVFSWIEGLLLRPYPLVRNLDRLMVMSGTSRSAQKGTEISWPDFVDFRRNATLIDAFVAEKIVGTTLSATGDRAERAPGSVVSANYFDALGVRPILGRGFEPVEETGRNAHPVVVISYQLWQGRFRGDPSIIGKTQMMNGVPHTIVGVAPEHFYGTFVGYAFQFWVPASMQETFDPGGYKLEDRSARWIEGFVTLKGGVAREQAQAELAALADRLAAEYPATNRGIGVRLLPVWQSPFNAMEVLVPALGIALAVVAAVLLIACANVANLLLLKSVARRREMTIRLAIGAGRARLVKQLLTEGVLLSVLGVAGGLVLAYACRNGLGLLFPPRGGVILRLPAELDARVVLVSVGVCLASTLFFALAPALLTSKIDLVETLKAEGGAVLGGRSRTWVRSSLVVLQVAVSCVLLIGAGLVLRSLFQMRTASPGFRPDGVAVTGVDVVAAGYTAQQAKTFQDELLARLDAVGSVQAAAFVRVAPFSYRGYSSAAIGVDGYEAPPDEPPNVDYGEVGPGYFSTLAIPLVAGREFTRADNERSEPVAVVNQAMADKFWRGQDPTNRRLLVRNRPLRVVGVAATAKYRNLLESPTPMFFVPLRQSDSIVGQGLIIRTRLRPEQMAAVLVREVRALDTNLAPGEVISMREQIDRTMSAQTVSVTVLATSGTLALLLAVIGLYGVMAAVVSQSTREFGLRLALGASGSDVMRLVIARGAALSAAGALAGTAAALGLTRLLGSMLYRVSPRDPAVYAGAVLIMGVAVMVACLVPARRATHADPLQALRG